MDLVILFFGGMAICAVGIIVCVIIGMRQASERRKGI